MKGLKTMAKKKETEPKGADKKNEKINGEKTDILQVDEGLMAVLCPAGASSIDFVYQAAGLSASRVVTAVAIPVWVVYVAYFVRRKRRSTGAPAEE